jgi:hypothetical protein
MKLLCLDFNCSMDTVRRLCRELDLPPRRGAIKRKNAIGVWCTPDEADAIRKGARRRQISISRYLNNLVKRDN